MDLPINFEIISPETLEHHRIVTITKTERGF